MHFNSGKQFRHAADGIGIEGSSLQKRIQRSVVVRREANADSPSVIRRGCGSPSVRQSTGEPVRARLSWSIYYKGWSYVEYVMVGGASREPVRADRHSSSVEEEADIT